MSYFEVRVCKLPRFAKHPNADRLSIVSIFDTPVIFGTEHFKEGDLVAHIPVDAMVPVSHPEFSFFADDKGTKLARVKAKRLKGIPSEGFLIPAPAGSKEGDNVAELLGITKYEEPVPISSGGETERDPGFAPHYTDIQAFNKFKTVFIDGEPVVCTEKIHGCNAMYLYRAGRLWCRSHNEYKKDTPSCAQCQTECVPGVARCPNPACGLIRKVNLWWKVAKESDLEAKLKTIENYAVFGENYGQVQDLNYGAKKGQTFFRAFDVFNTRNGQYLSHDEGKKMVTDLGIEWVPELYRGPYNETAIRGVVDGKSTLADNIREGCVVKPLTERYDQALGRVILKVISIDYKLRKGGSEHH